VFKHFATGGGGVLWDQPLSAVNVNAYVNQQFPDATTYSSYLADDFVNPAAWNISTIFVPGDTWYSGGTPTNLFCATSLTWQIYADNAGIPAGNPQSGGAMWSLTLPPTDPQVSITTGSGGRLTDASLNLTAPIGLPAGHWWFVFYPTMSFGTCGQYGRQAADTANGYTGQFINPGGAFGYGSFWQAWTVLSPTQHDIAFRLEGN